MVMRDYMREDYGRRPGWLSTLPVTKVVIVALIAVHLVQAVVFRNSPEAARWIRDVLYLNPQLALKRFHVWQLVTAALFHAPGVWHLGFNCLMFYFLGRQAELRLGARRYLLFCLGAAITASLAYLLESVVISRAIPMLGASGVIMGLLVLIACWYPNQTVLFFFVIQMPMWVLAAILVLADLIMMLQFPGGVATSAHLGGALYGWIHFRSGGGLERVFARIDSMAARGRQRRDAKRSERETDLRREVDRILDKVNREGMTALTEQERSFLKKASDKLRQ